MCDHKVCPVEYITNPPPNGKDKTNLSRQVCHLNKGQSPLPVPTEKRSGPTEPDLGLIWPVNWKQETERRGGLIQVCLPVPTLTSVKSGVCKSNWKKHLKMLPSRTKPAGSFSQKGSIKPQIYYALSASWQDGWMSSGGHKYLHQMEEITEQHFRFGKLLSENTPHHCLLKLKNSS